MGLYPCLHRELYQGRGQVENCRSQHSIVPLLGIIKKKSKNVSNAAAINFLFSCVGFCIAETSELQKKDLLGLLWNHLVIHVQLADFLPIDSNQGKNAAAASTPATL